MPVQDKVKAFKAYDVRGVVGETLDAELAVEIGRAVIAVTGARSVAVGADNRPSSPMLKAAVIEGITRAGADVHDIGSTGTEQIYFAAQHLDIDFGIQITASHNPISDNGMKFILRDGKPVDSALLAQIRDRVVDGKFENAHQLGAVQSADIMSNYVDHILGYIDAPSLRGMKILTNAGNGMAGHVIDAIEARLAAQDIPTPFIKMFHEADSNFPNGIPNPLLPENRPPTIAKLRETGADLAIAWDGDFDRCFFFDEKGEFIEGYYIVGLLAEAFLKKHGSGKVVYDPRLTWNTIETAKRNHGAAVQSRVGHAFMKAAMREHDAHYGGEMSAHHYFRDFAYCDSGMIPWLLLVELMVKLGKPLSRLVAEAQAAFPCSGEINYVVADTKAEIAKIHAHYEADASAIDETDGIGMEFDDWRLNLRGSNTEPLLRLNVESRGDAALMHEKTAEVAALITKL